VLTPLDISLPDLNAEQRKKRRQHRGGDPRVRSASCGLAQQLGRRKAGPVGSFRRAYGLPAVTGKTMPTARMPLPVHVSHADRGGRLPRLAGPRLFLPKRGDRDVGERGRGDPHHRLRDLRESQIRCGAVDLGASDGEHGRRQPGRRRCAGRSLTMMVGTNSARCGAGRSLNERLGQRRPPLGCVGIDGDAVPRRGGADQQLTGVEGRLR
jgi:hypothetical protein